MHKIIHNNVKTHPVRGVGYQQNHSVLNINLHSLVINSRFLNSQISDSTFLNKQIFPVSSICREN